MSLGYRLVCLFVVAIAVTSQDTADELTSAIDKLNDSVRKFNAANENLERGLCRLENYIVDIYKKTENVQKRLEKTESSLLNRLASLEKDLLGEIRTAGKHSAEFLKDGLEKVVNSQSESAIFSLQVLEKSLLERIDVQTARMSSVIKERLRIITEAGYKCEEQNGQVKETLKNLTQVLVSDIHKLASMETKDSVKISKETRDCVNNNHVKNSVSCHQLRNEEVTCDGVYKVTLEGRRAATYVYCDMNDDGGGWTVILNRDDSGDVHTSFEQNWDQYRTGFGNLEQEFWLGNDKLHAITTATEDFVLKVTLESFDGDSINITYDSFRVNNEESGYRLHIGEATPSTEGSSLREHNGQPFSTWDRNNEGQPTNCAENFRGGWWFKQCFYAMLTGPYQEEDDDDQNIGIKWLKWKGGENLKAARMKIRPKYLKRN